MSKRNQSKTNVVESTRYSVLTQDEPEIVETETIEVEQVALAPELQAAIEYLKSKVDPAELDAFLAATNLRGIKTPKERKPREPKPTRECLCGCGRETKSLFAMGHDAKVKSVLLARSTGKVVKTSLGNQDMAEWMPSDELKAYIAKSWAGQFVNDEPWVAVPLVVKEPKPRKAAKAQTEVSDEDAELEQLVADEIAADEAAELAEDEFETELA